MNCPVCGALKQENKHQVRELSEAGHFELPKPVSVPAGTKICWQHESLEEKRQRFEQSIRDEIRCAHESYERGALTKEQRDESITWANEELARYTAEWQNRLSRVQAVVRQYEIGLGIGI
jgi:hypothetical protein